MGPIKAAGCDGFPSLFFQRFWHIIGQEVGNFYLEILNKGGPVDGVNLTTIVLIPKVASPIKLKNFQPINLCTIIAKTVANRLQKLLDKFIDKAQSAFVPDRLITDNILLACELMHSLKQKRIGNNGSLILKMDMSKAYNRVEWFFLEKVMQKMRFVVFCVFNHEMCTNG
ncbi:reverse transcriptase [Gossypium australe]|uniref:Reverse transcriptase n=1 Tax=Gossypium australe TaxID=47621 RepID=A0A5B6WI51_9ROSI|nr:reverse transcriptase [Gossypium australe]